MDPFKQPPRDPVLHVRVDVVTASVVQSSLPGAASTPLVAAEEGEGSKRAMFGDMRHNQLVPFAVECGGAMGREAQRLFTRCKEACVNRLDASAPLQTWSAMGFCNFYGQLISCVTLRGLGSLLLTTAARIRQSSHATWGA